MAETTPDDIWAEYFNALGEFYHNFTDLEATMAQVVALAILGPNANHKHASAVFAVVSTGRMGTLKDTIKRVLRVTEASNEHRANVDAVFAQLGEIQFLRDRLAHYPTYLVDESQPPVFENTDMGLSKEAQRAQALVFEVSALTAATADIKAAKPFVDLIFQELVEQLRKLPREFVDCARKLPTWQYKPSMLTRCRPQFDDSHLEPFRPPQS